ncbi:MAG: glycoside hydrolase family 3 protein [Clostridium sp.]|nr:glycoside hydrolase family 3 protein [Clostridium sp.]
MGKLINRKKHLFSEEELEDDEIDDIEDEDIDMDEDDDDDEDEDNEDDDDEEDNDDIEEDDMEEEEESEEDRRFYRHKRRIRNQIISYTVVGLIIIALAAGGIIAGGRIASAAKEKKQAAEMEAAHLENAAEAEPQNMIVEAPPEIEVATMDEQLNELVNNYIETMPLEDKVAGLFIITPEALTGVGTVTQAGDATQEALNKYAVGGLIYFSQNIIDKEQLTEMLSSTPPKSKYPMFLAVDEEGGEVSRVANSDIEVIKVDNMADIGENGDASAAYETGITIGSYLSELGFNLNFAPVADVVTEEGSGVLGKRSFGADAGVCAEMVANVVDGMQGTGVSACLKHFPGIGSANEDTHDGKVELEATLDSMKNSDFLPFQAGIEAGADFVMVGHVIASSLDAELVPSSLSKAVVTDILRGELGFDGVVITDALDMGAITEDYTSEEAAVKAIEAGVDILLMPEDFEAAYNGLLAAVREGTISEDRIDESLRRIYRIKCADKLA